MKLNFGRRLVLFIHWLLSLAIVALGVVLYIWPEYQKTFESLLAGTNELIYAVTVLAVYLIFTVGALCIIFGGRKQKDDHRFITVDSSESGRTRIAVVAVDQMIRQAVRGVDGIAEMKSGIINNGDSIAITADVALLNGAHVPTVTANIQRAIRGYIEKNCGVRVRGVSVSVHSLTDAQPEGRRGRRKKAEAPAYSDPAPVAKDYARASEPDYSALSAPEEPVAPAAFEESEPIRLTLDAEAPAQPVENVEEAPAPEVVPEPAPEPAPEAPAEQSAPAPKKRRFGFFGRHGKAAPVEESAPVEEPAPVEEAAPVEEPVVADEFASVEEPASEEADGEN